jgi:hypothetical protein
MPQSLILVREKYSQLKELVFLITVANHSMLVMNTVRSSSILLAISDVKICASGTLLQIPNKLRMPVLSQQ